MGKIIAFANKNIDATSQATPSIGMSKTQRDMSIDIMKGIAIICVILGHIKMNYQILNHLIFSFHMPLFFILAGLFYRSSTDYMSKLKKDYKRLVFPYIATMGVLVSYSTLTHVVLRHDYEYAYLTYWGCLYPEGHWGVNQANSVPVWFLLALFWCRTVYNFIYTSMKRLYAFMVIFVISVSATLLASMDLFTDIPFAIMQGLSAMLFYLIGHVYVQFSRKISTNVIIIAVMGGQLALTIVVLT